MDEIPEDVMEKARRIANSTDNKANLAHFIARAILAEREACLAAISHYPDAYYALKARRP